MKRSKLIVTLSNKLIDGRRYNLPDCPGLWLFLPETLYNSPFDPISPDILTASLASLLIEKPDESIPGMDDLSGNCAITLTAESINIVVIKNNNLFIVRHLLFENFRFYHRGCLAPLAFISRGVNRPYLIEILLLSVRIGQLCLFYGFCIY